MHPGFLLIVHHYASTKPALNIFSSNFGNVDKTKIWLTICPTIRYYVSCYSGLLVSKLVTDKT